MLVAHHLDLDVARVDDEFLEEDAIVAEGAQRLGLHGGEALGHVGVGVGDADTLAAAAGRGLDHDRIADPSGDGDRLVRRLDQPHVAGDGGDAGGGGQFLGADLVAHGLDGLGVGADEGDALVAQTAGEAGVLGQEAEAGVDGFRARLPHRFDDPVGQQIGLGCGRRADQHGLVGHLDRQRTGIGLGIDLHGRNAHAAAGLDDADGDFTTVGDQDLGEHAAVFGVFESEANGIAAGRTAPIRPRSGGSKPEGLFT